MSRTIRRNHLNWNRTRYIDQKWKQYNQIILKKKYSVEEVAEKQKRIDEEFEKLKKIHRLVLLDGIYYSYNGGTFRKPVAYHMHYVAVDLTEEEARERVGRIYDGYSRDHSFRSYKKNVKHFSKRKVRQSARFEKHQLMIDEEYDTVPHEWNNRGEIWNWD